MNRLNHILILLTLVLLGTSVHSSTIADSLKVELNKEMHDTERVTILLDIIANTLYSNDDSLLYLGLDALSISKHCEWKIGTANSYNCLGMISYLKGNYPKVIEYYLKSLKLYEELDDPMGKIRSIGNMGIVHAKLGDSTKALELYEEALALGEELGNPSLKAIALTNIGNIHSENKNYNKAKACFEEALIYNIEKNRQSGIATSYANIGNIHASLLAYDTALDYFNKSLKINTDMNNKNHSCINLGNIGSLYLHMGNFNAAQHFLDTAISIGIELGAKQLLLDQFLYLTALHDSTNNERARLHSYKIYRAYRDSLSNEGSVRDLSRIQQKYEQEKIELISSSKEKEKLSAQKVAEQRRNRIQNSIIFIFLLITFGGTAMLGFVKVSPKLVEGLIFFSFLILFEFIVVLADPTIEQYSDGAPGYKLLFNGLLAGLIFPIHSYFEHKLKYKLLKENKI